MDKKRKRSKSARLKKYGQVYNSIFGTKKGVQKTEKKEDLNEYQKFFKKETEKYSNLPPSERMVKIAKKWEKRKKVLKNKTKD